MDVVKLDISVFTLLTLRISGKFACIFTPGLPSEFCAMAKRKNQLVSDSSDDDDSAASDLESVCGIHKQALCMSVKNRM